MRTLLISVIIYFVSNTAFGQNKVKFVNEFLNIGVDARAHGMFLAYTASAEGVSAGYWNPAGLAQMNTPTQISLMHAEWFGGVSQYEYAGLGRVLNKEKKGVGSINFVRMSIDNIPNTLSLIGADGSVNFDAVTPFSTADNALLLSYGQQLSKNISLGGTAKLIYRTIGNFGNAIGIGMDIGFKYISDFVDIAVVGRDITTTSNLWTFKFTPEEREVFIRTGNDIPVKTNEIAYPKLVGGIAFHSNRNSSLNKIRYLLEIDIIFTTDGRASGLLDDQKFNVEPTVGGELSYNKKFAIRAGLGNIQRLINNQNEGSSSISLLPSLGLGLNLGKLEIDYALNSIGSQGGDQNFYSHIISLTAKLENEKNKK